MKAITSIKFALSLTGLTLTGLLSPAAVHAAQLTYDMRIVNSSISGAVTGDNQHNFTAAANGEVLTVDIYALVQGADQDLTNDGFTKGVGGFISTGTLLGNFRGDPTGGAKTNINNVAPFIGLNAGAQSGFTSDLDGDGDLDVGSNLTTGNPAPVPWFVANSDKNGGFDPTFGVGTGSGPAVFLIGETTFTITGGTGSTTLQFSPRFKSDGTANAKKLDVITVDSFEVDLNGNSTGAIDEIGATIFIPEPSAIGMLLLGTLGLVGFRRSAFRRLIA